MSMKKIRDDAENLTVKNNKLINIGGKLEKKLPKYQFMGLMKIVYKDFITMEKFYRKVNNMKIDFTSFLDLLVRNNKLSISCIKTNKLWFEVDTSKDFAVAKKIMHKVVL
jgi:choline kinase